MSFRLRFAEIWLPGFVRKKYFRELSERTARAFDVPAPDLSGLTAEDAWGFFARFSQEQASGLQKSESARERAEQRLRAEALEFGRRLARILGVRTRRDFLRAARLLYRSIRIDFRGDESGRIRIPCCAFAAIYSPATCRMISALDAGLLIGLAGGGTLSFSSRLSEGASACLASFDFPETLR